MYDRPNAIKGRYVKIPNMLIFVAEPVNHEVIDLWRLFNIIYIMRTDVVVGKLRCRVLIIPVGTQTFLTCNRITISVRLFSSDF